MAILEPAHVGVAFGRRTSPNRRVHIKPVALEIVERAAIDMDGALGVNAVIFALVRRGRIVGADEINVLDDDIIAREVRGAVERRKPRCVVGLQADARCVCGEPDARRRGPAKPASALDLDRDFRINRGRADIIRAGRSVECRRAVIDRAVIDAVERNVFKIGDGGSKSRSVISHIVGDGAKLIHVDAVGVVKPPSPRVSRQKRGARVGRDVGAVDRCIVNIDRAADAADRVARRADRGDAGVDRHPRSRYKQGREPRIGAGCTIGAGDALRSLGQHEIPEQGQPGCARRDRRGRAGGDGSDRRQKPGDAALERDNEAR